MAYQKEERDKALELFRTMTKKEASRLSGVSIETLYRWQREEKGIKTERAKNKYYDTEMHKRVISLLKENVAVKEIAKLTGVSQNTIRNWRKKEKIQSKEKRGIKGYRATEKGREVITLLKEGNANAEKISELTGIPIKTIRRWKRQEGMSKGEKRGPKKYNRKEKNDDNKDKKTEKENLMNQLVKRLRQAIKNRNVEAINSLTKTINEMLNEVDLEQQETIKNMLEVAKEIIENQSRPKKSEKEQEI